MKSRVEDMKAEMSQSLFYWKTLCNVITLLEDAKDWQCRNPCFTGKLSAIMKSRVEDMKAEMSQSLFYWKTLCNNRYSQCTARKHYCHNPCFTGKLSAIHISPQHSTTLRVVAILVLLENSLQCCFLQTF